jgi:hypothetical protein
MSQVAPRIPLPLDDFEAEDDCMCLTPAPAARKGRIDRLAIVRRKADSGCKINRVRLELVPTCLQG